MDDKNIEKRTPPKNVSRSIQYDLFSQFITNNIGKVSNTVEIWESIPKYFFTAKQVEKLRTIDGLAHTHTWQYEYNNAPCAVKIQPALIAENGVEKAFFPGATEELVEEALKKILSDQRYGLHDYHNAETWIQFSLSMILKELKIRRRSRNLSQIKHAIDVMSGCIITLYKEDKKVWKGSILQDLVTIGRDKYLENSSAQHIAKLPLFISHAINHIEYRQFNYDRLMSCGEQLTRWIYKQLIHKFKQASFMNGYHFMYSTLQRNSCLLQQSRSNDNRRKVITALNNLKKNGVIVSYHINIRKEGKFIKDVKYTLRAAPDFISEQKAANKRSRDNHILALKGEKYSQLPPVG